MTQNEREHPRFALSVSCQLRTVGGVRRQSHIIDLSEMGARIETMYKGQEGELVWLDLAEYRNLAARVVWSSPSFIGLRFGSPMHPSILEDILSTEPSYYEVDCEALYTLGMRIRYEVPHTFSLSDAEQLTMLGLDVQRAANINQIVQGLRRFEDSAVT